MYKVPAVPCFYMFMLCNFELLTEILNIMCFFFFCTDEMGEFNKEFAGFYLLNLLCGDWEDPPTTCSASGRLWGCEC